MSFRTDPERTHPGTEDPCNPHPPVSNRCPRPFVAVGRLPKSSGGACGALTLLIGQRQLARLQGRCRRQACCSQDFLLIESFPGHKGLGKGVRKFFGKDP